MTPRIRFLPAIALLLTAAPVFAQSALPLANADRAAVLSDGSQLWFVELASPPAIEAGDPAAIRAEQGTFRRNAGAAGIRLRERQSFRQLWNGLAIAVDSGELGKLRRIPGVVALYPVERVALPEEPGVTEPQLMSALTMTRADYVQRTLGYDGTGVRVGIIDTGVDYDHPDLGGDGVARSGSTMFPNTRVVAGWDFCGDDFDGERPVPDPYPDDCNGHGTHVAGIVGARGGVIGVAPGAQIGAYRIFGCRGETTTDLIVAALERAYDDRMDVVNLSIGAPFEWPDYPTSRAADRLAGHGVVVVGAQGNNGSSGLYAANAPGTGRQVISVASFQNVQVNLPAFRVTPDDHATVYAPVRGAPAPPLAGSVALARTGTRASAADACAELAAGSLAGQVALIRAGGCDAREKCLNAQHAAAAGVVLYSDSFFGVFRPEVTGDPAVAIPVVAISRLEGELLDDRLSQGAVTITWAVSSTPGFNGGLVSPFSSYGPAPDLSLKPNLGAPGGSVLSTWPLESGAYLNNSGTSMSTPHVAGAVALLLQAHPGTPVERVRTLLENNAVPRPWEGDPGVLGPVHRQGAGLLDIAAAIEARAWVEPGELELGESDGGVATRRLTIHNPGSRALTFALGHEPALATGPDPFFVDFSNGPAIVSFGDPTVTVPAGGTAHLQVAITPAAALADGSLYGGYLTLSPEGGGVLRVPYLGFKGDYQSLPVLTPTPAQFPWLARLVDGSLVNQPSGATFSLAGADVPWIAYHLHHQASRLEMEVFDATSGKSSHMMERFENAPRNTTAGSFFADPWDGDTQAGNGRVSAVPDGRYVIRISALRALGDPSNPEHWDRWTSPVITLARTTGTAALGSELATQGAPAPGDTPLSLAPVRPNPASGPMTFAFSLPRAGPVALEVFDIGGRRLASWRWQSLAAGERAVVWDGRTEAGKRAAAGAVLVRLSAMGRSLTRKAVVIP